MALSVCCVGIVMWRGHCVRRASVWTTLYRCSIDQIDSTGSKTGLTVSSVLAKLPVPVRTAVRLADRGTSQSPRECV
jgi:hypothetical protein